MNRLSARVLVLSLLMVPMVALAGEAPPEPPWKGSLGLSLLATSGNSNTETLGLSFQLERRPEPWGLLLQATFDRAEEDDELKAERTFARARVKRALGERTELFSGLQGEKDEFAGYELLFLVEAGGTWKALLGPKQLLSFDAGLTWTDEDRLPPDEDIDYVGGLVGLNYEWRISETASLTETSIYYPDFDNSDNWRLTCELGLQASIIQKLAVKLSYELRFRNQPIGDATDTDRTTKVSLVLNL